jgi:slit 2
VTTLGKDVFEPLFRLRSLKLGDNSLVCDCHLAWLARYLRRNAHLAPATRCAAPSTLRAQPLVELHDRVTRNSFFIF